MENVIQKYLAQRVRDDRGIQRPSPARSPSRSACWSSPTSRPTSTRPPPRRLVSIASTGARCGVYALISLDTKQALPTGMPAQGPRAELRRTSSGTKASSTGATPHFGQFPLVLDAPPDPGPLLAADARGRRARPQRQPRRGPVRVHRADARRVTGRSTAAPGSTSRSAAPGPPSSSTSSSARGRRSTS